MMKGYVTLILCLVGAASAQGASSGKTVVGKVKSFDEKTVRLEVDGKLVEFDVRRVAERKNLKVGQVVEVDLEKARLPK